MNYGKPKCMYNHRLLPGPCDILFHQTCGLLNVLFDLECNGYMDCCYLLFLLMSQGYSSFIPYLIK